MTDQETPDRPSDEVDGLESADVAAPVRAVEAPLTAGAVLRQAREARGQSIADVVQVIRFSARQIEALERDDYAALPGATVARGLVRNYAKFLKLDPGPLLAQLDPAVPVPEADVRPPANIGEAEQATLGERLPLRIIGIGIVAVMLVSVLGWFASQTDPAPQSVATAPGPVVASPTPVATADAAAPSAAQTPVPSAAAVALPPPEGGLRVEFDDRSWIEIRDATQRVVFSGEYPAGTRQNIDGRPPFQVWIGKASGVRLFLGERGIDLKPHTREEIARFTLE